MGTVATIKGETGETFGRRNQQNLQTDWPLEVGGGVSHRFLAGPRGVGQSTQPLSERGYKSSSPELCWPRSVQAKPNIVSLGQGDQAALLLPP